jgi:hypothetical protein
LSRINFHLQHCFNLGQFHAQMRRVHAKKVMDHAALRSDLRSQKS